MLFENNIAFGLRKISHNYEFLLCILEQQFRSQTTKIVVLKQQFRSQNSKWEQRKQKFTAKLLFENALRWDLEKFHVAMNFCYAF